MFKQSLLFILVAGSMALADGPCAQDKKTFCASAVGDKKKLNQCMKDNESKFSPACKKHRETLQDAIEETREACKEDIKKLCADVRPGGGRISVCLEAKKTQVSKACLDEIKESKNEKKALIESEEAKAKAKNKGAKAASKVTKPAKPKEKAP
jgi:Cysteine rich repeat